MVTLIQRMPTKTEKDPLMNDGALAYNQFLPSRLPPMSSFTVEAVREQAELIAKKVNEKLSHTFIRGLKNSTVEIQA
ncbi:unnamed protein product [Didymodactylos carnosus]|uniref:Uncharacterized protein n=1 Tax=Didymodactylos carnosus TaxID=1234261 RepID=A0A815Z4J0_9BILA|nr:unnamed protein product [Didymodactylos carnosus]CAF4444412.1 unnamed protein product [Didymodactylos carnosus]